MVEKRIGRLNVPGRDVRHGRAARRPRWFGRQLLISLLVGVVWSPGVFAQLPEDPLQIVPADQALSEEQADHVEATTLFAHGRVLLQRGIQLQDAAQKQQFQDALRQFQRAWWFESNLVSILEDIVPLAFQLDRKLEATRYLILAAEQQELPLELLEQIAAQLADLDDFDQHQAERALRLYQKVKQQQGDQVNWVTQFEIGRLSLALGKFEQAAEAFALVQQALDDPDTSRVPAAIRAQLLQRPEVTYTLLGECYLRAHRLDEAEAAFRAADKAKPNPAVLGFQLALVEQERGNHELARQHLEEYFAAKTTSAGLAPYVLLRRLIDGTSDTAEEPAFDPAADPIALETTDAQPETPAPSGAVIEKLKQLAQADPNNVLLGYYLADALRRTQQWDEAAALYQKLHQQKPAGEGYRGLVEIYHQQKQLKHLLTQLADVAWKTGSLDLLGSVVDTIASDQAVLDGLLQLVREPAPGDELPQGAAVALALLQAEAGNAELAVELMRQGLLSPGPAAGQQALNLAFTWLQDDQPLLAVEMFQRVLDDKLLPDMTAEVYFYLSAALVLAKEMDKALDAARQAGKLDPNSPRMLAREPWVLFQAERLDEARAKYVELLERFDGDHDSAENREAMRDTRLILSTIDVQREDLPAAEEWLQQILDEFPEDIGAYNDLGYLWSDQGKHLQRSLRLVQQAVEAEPDNIAYRDSLGWALFRLGRYQEAVGELEKAAAGDKVDGVILEHLGDAYAKADQPQKAVEAWQKAAQAFQDLGDNKRQQAMERKIQDSQSQ